MDKITTCMIVKNEEACLKGCLESIKGVGELIIVDTGSTDGTIAIAKQYTDRVYTDYKWNDDFAEARNYACDRCHTDWILTIDADEYIDNPELIPSIVEAAEVAGHKTISAIVESDRTGGYHYQPRLYKSYIRWNGAIHNYLNVVEDNKSDLRVIAGYSTAHKNDPNRAYRILSREVLKPGKVREIYYYAREHWYRKKYSEAIDWYDKYLKVAYWAPEIADAYLIRARCYVGLKNFTMARESCMRAININADFKEALHLMGRLTGPNNSVKWDEYADHATNKNVLFVRDREIK